MVEERKQKKRIIRKKLAVLGILAAVIVAGSILFSMIDTDAVQEFISSFGILAPLVFMLVMALAIIISPIPSIPLAIIAGAMFGGTLGGLYSLVGAETGALISFLIARKYGRAVVERYLKADLALLDGAYDKSLPWIIFGTRLLPVFQFDIVSYASGLTKIKAWKFALATFFGMMPVTLLLTYSGNVITLGNIWINVIASVVLILAMYFVPKYLIKHKDLILKKNKERK